LNFLVATNAGERPVGARKLALAAEIATLQDKLDQLAYCNRINWF